MNIKMSDVLDESYGDTPIEQLSNLLFESKESMDNKNYTIINELLLKINDACDFNTNKIPHYLTFIISSVLVNATDQIKEDLDYMAENYNSDYEEEHDYEDEDDCFYINTPCLCKLYLNASNNKACVLDFYSEFHSVIEESFKNKKSYINYQTCMNVNYSKHIKEISNKIKDNIDYEWCKVKDTHIKYISLKPCPCPSP